MTSKQSSLAAAWMTAMFAGFFFVASAQYTDTAAKSPVRADSIPQRSFSLSERPLNNHFKLKPYILPAVFVVYGVASLHTDALQDINESVHKGIYTAGQSQKTKADNYLQYAPAAAVYGLNIAGIHGKNNFLDRTVIYGLSNLIVGVAVNVTKHVTGEQRPDGSNNLSFPSGHTATAFAAAEFLRQEYKDVSAWYGVAGYAAAAATGVLRMVNNKHWLGDVVAGAGVGMISTRLAYWMYPAIKRTFSKHKDLHTMIMPAYQDRSFGLAMVHHF